MAVSAGRSYVPRTTNLHLSHSWGGGLNKWVEDFARHDSEAENLILSSVGTTAAYGLSFDLQLGETGEVIESWTPQSPICEMAVENAEYRERLVSVLERYQISRIYVSSLVGHSLDVLELDVPIIVVHHDYFPYCPALYLTFSRICHSCTAKELKECSRTNPLSTLFRKNGPEYWLSARIRYMSLVDRTNVQHVAPSVSVVRNLCRVDSRFEKLSFHVIEHGLATAERRNCFGGAEEGRRLRLVILGRLSRLKGLDRFERLFRRLRLVADVYLLGSGERLSAYRHRFKLDLIEDYRNEELTARLDAIRPDLALFLSEVPESHSYTLSEALAHGIPVCAPDLGSFPERLEQGKTGFIVDLDDDAIMERLLDLDDQREMLRQISNCTMASSIRTVTEMIEDYYRLTRRSGPAHKTESFRRSLS